MNREIIYQRKYPKINYSALLDEENHAKKAETDTATADIDIPSFDEILERIKKSTSYVLLPDRIEESQQFIEEAIYVSELYRMDLMLVRHTSHIVAELSFDCGINLTEIQPLLALSDECSFFTNIGDHELTITLEYFTHAVVRNGRVVRPKGITLPEQST